MAKKASLSPIGMHATYETFEDFQDAYGLWRDAYYHPFTIQKSHKGNDPDIEYLKIKYSCVHRGTPVYRGTGQRPNQTYLGKNCPAYLSVRFFKTLGQYVVNGINAEHNHETGPEVYLAYRQKRKLNEEERQKAILMIQTGSSDVTVAKTMTQLCGKLVATKDINNLRIRLKSANGLPSTSGETFSYASAAEHGNEHDSEKTDQFSIGLPDKEEEPRTPPLLFAGKLKGRPRKRLLPDVDGPLQSPPKIRVMKPPGSLPGASKTTAHPLGTKMNLIKMHEAGSQDFQASTIVHNSGSSAGPTKKVKIQAAAVVGPGTPAVRWHEGARPEQVYVNHLARPGSSRGLSSFSVPTYTGTGKRITSVPAKPLVMTKKRDHLEALITGLARVCPAEQLNTLGQVCKLWRERVRKALVSRYQVGLLMEHGVLAHDSNVEALFSALAQQLAVAVSLPRTALAFMSSAFFRPMYGSADRILQQTSGFERLLPNEANLCEIFGAGVVGSLYSGSKGESQITQAQESNIVGGVSVLLWPEIRNADITCLVLDQKRLREIDDNAYEMPAFVAASFGDLPLKSLLFFEHGSPSLTALGKIFDSLSSVNSAGFAFAGTEVCQSKISPSVHTTENQWGPSLVAVGFSGDKVTSTSMFLSEKVCSDAESLATHLSSWRDALGEIGFGNDAKLQHFCISFYCEVDKAGEPLQDDRNPNTLFATYFPDVALLGIQSQGHVYGYSWVFDTETKSFDDVLSTKSSHSCVFTLISVPRSP